MHTEFMSAMFRLKRHTKGEAAEPTIPPSTPATPARRLVKGKGNGDSSAATGTEEAAAEEEEFLGMIMASLPITPLSRFLQTPSSCGSLI